MDQIKKGEYELVGEAGLLERAEEVVIGEKTYLVESLILKDYHSKEIREWNKKKHSILITEITVLHNGNRIKNEIKYDTGYPPDGMTVKDIALNICGSDGISSHVVTEKDPILGARVIEIDTPPSVKFLIDSHMFYITGKFVKLEAEQANPTKVKQRVS